MPCVFYETGNEYEITYLHPLPLNQIVKIDNAGMGLVLMHKSVLTKLNEKFSNGFLFGENNESGEKFIGEDISFFRKVKAAGIPVHVHTGVTAQHMKRFSVDIAYYNLFWQAAAAEVERMDHESTKK